MQDRHDKLISGCRLWFKVSKLFYHQHKQCLFISYSIRSVTVSQRAFITVPQNLRQLNWIQPSSIVLFPRMINNKRAYCPSQISAALLTGESPTLSSILPESCSSEGEIFVLCQKPPRWTENAFLLIMACSISFRKRFHLCCFISWWWCKM